MPAGHRIVPHTADLALEAWAPDRAECIAEAVRALVESFADVRAAIPRETVTAAADAAADEDLLVRVLDEVIYQLDVHGRVPVDVSVSEAADGAPDRAGLTAGETAESGGNRVELRFAAAPVAEVEVTGAIPKAVTRHELRFGRGRELWHCHVTVDI